MSEKITLNGIVLSSMPVGDYNKRIVVLTKERGKITAFARGARRPNSSLQASTNIFCYATFEAFPGKEAYTIVKSEIHESFRDLTLDIDKTYYGCYFLEVADYFATENSDVTELLNLLYLTLKALVKGIIPPNRIRRIFELRTLVFNGTYPNVFACVRCGSKDKIVRYDRHLQGVVCEKCNYSRGSSLIDPTTLYTLQYIISSPLQKLYAFQLSDEVFERVDRIIRGFYKYYISKPFQTLRFIEESDESFLQSEN